MSNICLCIQRQWDVAVKIYCSQTLRNFEVYNVIVRFYHMVGKPNIYLGERKLGL